MASTIRGSNNFDSAWGNAQTWTNVASSRAFNTTYTNSTGAPIFVIIAATMANGSPVSITVGGLSFFATSGYTNGAQSQASFIVPNGVTYSASSTNTSAINNWLELR